MASREGGAVKNCILHDIFQVQEKFYIPPEVEFTATILHSRFTTAVIVEDIDKNKAN